MEEVEREINGGNIKGSIGNVTVSQMAYGNKD